MDWSKSTTTSSTNELGVNFIRDRMPARYVGIRHEFYSGVTPGAEGTAERITCPGGSQFFSFSVGGAWLSVHSEDDLEEVTE